MSTFSVCGLSNIQATPNAIPLAFNFCDCPAALDVLKEIEVPVTVQVKSDFVLAGSMEPLISSKCKFTGALITLAENHPRDFQIAVFANEALNVLNFQKLMPFFRDACNGDVDMDEYANTLVDSKYQALHKTRQLLNSCRRINGFSFGSQLNKQNLTQWEYFWKADVLGETDKFKIEWVDRFQDEYCHQHSHHFASCSANKEKFCDLLTHEGLSSEDFNRRMNDRVCEYHINAPQRFKKVTSPLLDAKCIKKINSRQFTNAVLGTTIATFIAIVASRVFNNFF